MSLMLLGAGCEPTSIADARNQLGRGPARIVQFMIPVVQDTVTVADFLDSSIVTPGGLIGIKFDSQTVAAGVGDKLKFDNLSFDPFTFSYDQLLQSTQTDSLFFTIGPGSITPAPPLQPAPGVSGDTIRFGTAQGTSVTGATVGSGYVVRVLANGSGCDGLTLSASLVDSLGGTVAGFPPTVVNDGQTIIDSVNLAGATMSGYARLVAGASGAGACPPTGSVTIKVVVRPLTLASVTLVGINESFNQSYAPFASETRITAVDTVNVLSGSFTLQVQNKLPVQFGGMVTLNGVTLGGAPLQQAIVVPGASSGNVVFNLNGTKIAPGAVMANVSGAATAAQATFTPAVTTDAITVTGGGNLQIQSLFGSLDPAKTPELTVSVSDTQQIDTTQFDFGDLRDAVDSATLNDAQVTLTLNNTSGAPIVLSNFLLRTDSAGVGITLPVADPGMTTVSLARGQVGKVLTIQAARLVNAVVHQALAGQPTSVVATGDAVVGDGALSTITRSDSVSVGLRLTVGLDVTVPAGGVTFSKTSAVDGADLEDKDANQIAQRVDTASTTAIVDNGVPFGVEVRIALILPTVADSVADSIPPQVTADSIFRTSNRVELGPVSLAPASVDALGRVTAAVLDTASIGISGSQARVLLGRKFWAAVRVTLLPNSSNPRGAIRPTDQVTVHARGSVRLKSGGAP